MCDCIEDVAEKALERMRENVGSSGVIGEGELQNTGFSFSTGITRTYNEFKYEFTPNKKDGSLGRTVNKTISIYHSFCPFCGEAYEKGEDKLKPKRANLTCVNEPDDPLIKKADCTDFVKEDTQ